MSSQISCKIIRLKNVHYYVALAYFLRARLSMKLPWWKSHIKVYIFIFFSRCLSVNNNYRGWISKCKLFIFLDMFTLEPFFSHCSQFSCLQNKLWKIFFFNVSLEVFSYSNMRETQMQNFSWNALLAHCLKRQIFSRYFFLSISIQDSLIVPKTAEKIVVF